MPSCRAAPLATLVIGIGLIGQDAAAQQAPRADGWQFALTPYVWFSGISGDVRTRSQRDPDVSVSASFGDLLSNLDGIPFMGTAEVRNGRMGLVVDLLSMSVEQDVTTRDVLFNGGKGKVTATTGTVLGMYRAVDTPRQSLDIGAGLRPWDITTKLSLNAGLAQGVSGKASGTWADPVLALRYHLNLGSGFGLTAYGDAAGFGVGSIMSWQAIGSVDYDANHWLTLRAGFRYLSVDRKNDVQRFDISMAGPFIAATFRF
jgi:hypothetical protein